MATAVEFDHNKVAATGWINSRSIHPRVENGRTKHKKVNTCAATRRKNPTKAAERLMTRQRVWDGLDGRSKAACRCRPGSMKK